MALPPPITITESAASRVKSLLEKRGKPSAGVKVGVRSGGCSGLSYTIEYADEIGPFDEVVAYPNREAEEFKVIIDPKAIMYLIGSQMDYVEEKMKSGFTFQNPNEKGKCGCGESFSV
jgi:iron-sulfur cluster assembly protein